MTHRLFMPAIMLLLAACTASNGTCVIPETEAEIQKSLKITALRDALAQLRVPYDYSESYLQDNPDCCSVENIPVEDHAPLITWDKYSSPRYYVRVAVAAKSDEEIKLYTQEGKGDTCGRIPDPISSEEMVAGKPPRSLHKRVDAKGRPMWPPLSSGPSADVIEVTSEGWQPYPVAHAKQLLIEKYRAQSARRTAKP